MATRPWEADRPLTPDAAATLIAERFPDLGTGVPRLLGSGWQFDAFLTADDWVFRFPRREEHAALFAAEKPVHRLVSGALRAHVRIPVVERLADPTETFPYPFAGHRFIPGIGVDLLAPDLAPKAATEIGAALGAIHAIPADEARAAGVREMDVEDPGRRAWFERAVASASSLRGLDRSVDRALDGLRDASWPPPVYGGPKRFIHHDLSPEHLLVDPGTGRLAGILDWTDTILGDPARDFVTLVTSRGWQFAARTLDAYPHGVDRAFLDRLGSMTRLLSLLWLGHAHEQSGDVAKHVAWVRNAFGEVDG